MQPNNPVGVAFGTDPGHARTIWDSLPFGGGRKLGDVSDRELYSFCDRGKIFGFNHRLGRQAVAERFAAALKKIGKDAADAAVRAQRAEFLCAHRSSALSFVATPVPEAVGGRHRRFNAFAPLTSPRPRSLAPNVKVALAITAQGPFRAW
jgi:hypothetical protein